MPEYATTLEGYVRLTGQPVKSDQSIFRIMGGPVRPIGNGQGYIAGCGQAARNPIVCRDHSLLHAARSHNDGRMGSWGVRSGDLCRQAYSTVVKLNALGDKHRGPRI